MFVSPIKKHQLNLKNGWTGLANFCFDIFVEVHGRFKCEKILIKCTKNSKSNKFILHHNSLYLLISAFRKCIFDGEYFCIIYCLSRKNTNIKNMKTPSKTPQLSTSTTNRTNSN